MKLSMYKFLCSLEDAVFSTVAATCFGLYFESWLVGIGVFSVLNVLAPGTHKLVKENSPKSWM